MRFLGSRSIGLLMALFHRRRDGRHSRRPCLRRLSMMVAPAAPASCGTCAITPLVGDGVTGVIRTRDPGVAWRVKTRWRSGLARYRGRQKERTWPSPTRPRRSTHKHILGGCG